MCYNSQHLNSCNKLDDYSSFVQENSSHICSWASGFAFCYSLLWIFDDWGLPFKAQWLHICTTWFNTLKFYILPTHSVFMCFVWISEQTAIISLYSINWLVFITETECLLRGTDWVFVYNSTLCPSQCIYVFCMDLRTNSDYFPIQH